MTLSAEAVQHTKVSVYMVNFHGRIPLLCVGVCVMYIPVVVMRCDWNEVITTLHILAVFNYTKLHDIEHVTVM